MEFLIKLIYDLKDKKIVTHSEDDLVFLGKCLSYFNKTNSQNFQDVFAIHSKKRDSPGMFVEFGACDGVSSSNTFMLEKEMGWIGALAEPNPAWHDKLIPYDNRPYSNICTDCVWIKTGETILFDATDEETLSTITGYGMDDEHAQTRKNKKQIEVKTISLFDFLERYAHWETTDYMSVDTEGSEYDILEQFFKDNKGQHKISAISIEHNYMPIRENIYKLMTDNGYVRKYEFMSRWDDFYVLKD